jgi:hypothetical protein
MKVRGDYVTNSSSSSFILAFKNKKDAYAEACIAFMKMKDCERQEGERCLDEDDDYEYEHGFSFDDNACALDNVILAMENGQITAWIYNDRKGFVNKKPLKNFLPRNYKQIKIIEEKNRLKKQQQIEQELNNKSK